MFFLHNICWNNIDIDCIRSFIFYQPMSVHIISGNFRISARKYSEFSLLKIADLTAIIVPFCDDKMLHLLRKEMIKSIKLWEIYFYCFLCTAYTLIHTACHIRLNHTIYILLFLVIIYHNSENFCFLKNIIDICPPLTCQIYPRLLAAH